VDKLRKISKWIWLNKERMLLAVMFALLCYRVYVVVYPPPPPQFPLVKAPTAHLPESPEERKELGLPEAPPPRPPMDLPGNFSSLYNRNPFWYYSGQKQETGTEVTAENLGIKLLNIREVGGRWRAQLRTSSTTKWYDEGEQFEEFELQKINPEDKTVVIYAERYAKRFTLSIGG
jgi:hypothetical protein